MTRAPSASGTDHAAPALVSLTTGTRPDARLTVAQALLAAAVLGGYLLATSRSSSRRH